MNDILIVVLILVFYFTPILFQFIIVLQEYKAGNKNPFLKFKRVLKYSLAGLAFFLALLALLSHTNYLDYEKPIPYSKVNEITFKNFRGLEFFKKSLYGNERFAYIVTSIECDINKDHVVITSFFHPSRSFVYNTFSNSDELLTHEIYHFKITELHARMAKKKIAVLDEFNKKKIQNILDEVKLELNQYQQKYDYDTFHSYVYSEQKRYEQKVDSLLTLLNEFEAPKLIF